MIYSILYSIIAQVLLVYPWLNCNCSMKIPNFIEQLQLTFLLDEFELLILYSHLPTSMEVICLLFEELLSLNQLVYILFHWWYEGDRLQYVHLDGMYWIGLFQINLQFHIWFYFQKACIFKNSYVKLGSITLYKFQKRWIQTEKNWKWQCQWK